MPFEGGFTFANFLADVFTVFVFVAWFSHLVAENNAVGFHARARERNRKGRQAGSDAASRYTAAA